MSRYTALNILAVVAGLGLVLALWAWGVGGMERQCNERGGWFTYIGGYPTCLPPRARP